MNVLLSTGLLVAVMLSLLPVPVAAQAEDDFVQELIARMSVEERVGQLFVVTFTGSDVGSGSDIAQLIVQYRVGGWFSCPATATFPRPHNRQRAPSLLAPSL